MSPQSPRLSPAASQGEAEAIDFDRARRRDERADLAAHWTRTAAHLAAERDAAARRALALEQLAADHLAAERETAARRALVLEQLTAEHAALTNQLPELERLAAFERAVLQSRGWRLLQRLRPWLERAS